MFESVGSSKVLSSMEKDFNLALISDYIIQSLYSSHCRST